MKKRVLALILSSILVASLTACGSTKTAETATTETPTTQAADTQVTVSTEEQSQQETASSQSESDATYTIGISQFAEHPSLENCKNGFLAGLEEAGITEGKNLTVLFDNAQADTATASTISDSYVSQNVNLICAIATPSAMSAYNSCLNTEIPTIFTAVSDPIGAGLANADGSPAGNVTGTSDALPVTEQLAMIRKILPDAKKIGIIYTTSEANSVSTIEEYKKHAEEYGFEIVDTGINTIGDVQLAAADLVEKVDCITNLTDNTVVSALQTELDAANSKGIPVFGSEVEQVKAGCVASMGLDYFELGKQTGAMAAKVLTGEKKASELNFEVITEASLYVNTAAADALGLKLDAQYLDKAAETFDSIVTE